MDATKLVHIDGMVIDPVAIAAIYPPDGDLVRFQLLGAAESLGVFADSKAHAEELHAYLVACKTLSKRGAETIDGPRARMIVAAIIEDLDGRSGLGFDSVDAETIDEIRATWERLVLT